MVYSYLELYIQCMVNSSCIVLDVYSLYSVFHCVYHTSVYRLYYIQYILFLVQYILSIYYTVWDGWSLYNVCILSITIIVYTLYTLLHTVQCRIGAHYIRLNRSALPCPPMVAWSQCVLQIIIITIIMIMTLIKVKVTMSIMTMMMMMRRKTTMMKLLTIPSQFAANQSYLYIALNKITKISLISSKVKLGNIVKISGFVIGFYLNLRII